MYYPNQAAALIELLKNDQKEWRNYAHAEFVEKKSKTELKQLKTQLRKNVRQRAQLMEQLLQQVGEPTLDNLGPEACQAVSVLATHDSLETTRRVLAAFEECYKKSPDSTYAQSIPAMTDWVAVLEHRPQRFGTIWLFDDNQYPFLPLVEDFEHIEQRRASYGIGPLRWPKSMAIPEADQQWLTKPLSTLVMRKPTEAEDETLMEFYLPDGYNGSNDR